MMEEQQGGCMIYVPTLGDRLRRWLGYRMHFGDEPPIDPARHLGWMKTVTNFHFSMSDRIRLLLTGRLRIELTQHTTQQVDESVNSVDFRIYAPFED